MKPNILWICTDQQRFDSLGCNGNPHAVTPHLDALAEEGIRFDRFITAHPVCMPSRASFFTGSHASRHGVYTNGIPLANRAYVAAAPDSPYGPPLESHIETLPEILAVNGYHTRSVGKLHLTPTQAAPELKHPENHWLWKEGVFDDWHGPYYGFEHVDLTLHHGESTVYGHYRNWLREQAPEIEARLSEPMDEMPLAGISDLYPGRIPAEWHNSTWIGNQAAAFFESPEAQDKPFFMWMSFPDPHHPFTPPAELAEEFRGHAYLKPTATEADLADKPSAWPKAGMAAVVDNPEAIPMIRRYTDAQVHLIDRAVGHAVQSLKENGLWENTVILFTSDHGDFLGEYGRIRKCGLPCNALNHVPFILRDPARRIQLPARAPVSGVDLFPTLLELAGVEVPPRVDGSSLLDDQPDRRAMIQCIGGNYEERSLTIYDERYRLTWFMERDEWEAYDHDQDPYERQNCIDTFRQTGAFSCLRNELMERHAYASDPQSGRFSCW
ncbi:sulfatase-like hydrolase/transferase [Kiritimatiellaeota bacterium B1221]|nr:sulfatase-like hydrolase/transferase [Kiritimatiellaeota bacterium B1221]